MLAINTQVLRCFSGEINRLIVQAPPQHGKSELISKFTPAWWLGMRPSSRVILTSYEADFARSWGKKVRDLLQAHGGKFGSAEFPEGVTVDPSSAAQDRWDLVDVATKRETAGGMITAGAGGPITGKGANLAIIDDPVKNQREALSPAFRESTKDWYRTVLRTRLRRGGVIILIMTRWVEDDLAGFVLEEASKGAEPWHVLNLPAFAEGDDVLGRREGEPLCPELHDREALNAARLSLGTFWFNAMFQQRPAPAEGGILKRAWWQYWRELPKFDRMILSADLAFKETKRGSFVVFQAWGQAGADKYLVDQVRGRMDYPTTKKAWRAFAAKHPQARRKLIEEKANGAAILADMKREISGMIPITPVDSKVSRAHAVAADVEAGNVYLPDPTVVDWPVGDFVEEAANFPNAMTDDQVDCATQALDYLIRRRTPKIISLRPKAQ